MIYAAAPWNYVLGQNSQSFVPRVQQTVKYYLRSPYSKQRTAPLDVRYNMYRSSYPQRSTSPGFSPRAAFTRTAATTLGRIIPWAATTYLGYEFARRVAIPELANLQMKTMNEGYQEHVRPSIDAMWASYAQKYNTTDTPAEDAQEDGFKVTRRWG